MSKYGVPILYCLAAIFIFFIEAIEPSIVPKFALLPKSPEHIPGIFTAVFLHANLEHLSANFLTMAVCLFGIFYFYKDIALAVTLIAHMATGTLIWLFARQVYHIGASGLVYALVFFVLISALIKRNKRLAVFAFIVLSLQSGLIWGMMPQNNHISWESHLFGGITGVILAILFRHKGPQSEPEIIFDENDEEEPDEYAGL